MARVKARWHRTSRPRTAEENSTVLAANAYKAARLGIQRMLGADFDFTSDRRRFAILAELLAFQVQMTDRLAYPRLDEINRRRLVNGMGQNLARLYAENQAELGVDDDLEASRRTFVTALNGCLAEYAELTFGDDGRPGYGSLRYLAKRLVDIAEPEDRRWLIEVIVDVEAPKVVDALLGAWRLVYPKEAVAAPPENANPGT